MAAATDRRFNAPGEASPGDGQTVTLPARNQIGTVIGTVSDQAFATLGDAFDTYLDVCGYRIVETNGMYDLRNRSARAASRTGA